MDPIPTDDTGRPIAIDDTVRITHAAGEVYQNRVGVVVGLDELDQWGQTKGYDGIWVRLHGDTAIVSIHPARMRVIKAARS